MAESKSWRIHVQFSYNAVRCFAFHLLLWYFLEGFIVSPKELVHGVPWPG